MVQKPKSFQVYKNTFSVCLSIPTFHILCLCLPSRKKREKRGSGEHYVGDGGGGGREEREGHLPAKPNSTPFPNINSGKKATFFSGEGMAVCTYNSTKIEGVKKQELKKGPPPGIEGRRKLISQKSSRKSCQPDATSNVLQAGAFCVLSSGRENGAGVFV